MSSVNQNNSILMFPNRPLPLPVRVIVMASSEMGSGASIRRPRLEPRVAGRAVEVMKERWR